MQYHLLSTIIGFIIGISSNYLFLLLMGKYLRPSIDISQYISKTKKNETTYYSFKFINKTKVEIIDVRISAMFLKSSGDLGGKNLDGKEIELLYSFYPSVTSKKNKKDKQDYNLHALRVNTKDNLEDKWTDTSSFIRMTITAKHSLTGLGKTFIKDFDSNDCITDKKFLSGNELEVK